VIEWIKEWWFIFCCCCCLFHIICPDQFFWGPLKRKFGKMGIGFMALTGLAFFIGGAAAIRGKQASWVNYPAAILCILAGLRLIGDSYKEWKQLKSNNAERDE